MSTEENESQSEQQPLTRYSDLGYFGRSFGFALTLLPPIYFLSDASGWQAWAITGTGFLVFIAISMQQATIIENGVMLTFVLILVASVSTTEIFGFHWSILLIGVLAALNGMGGRESQHRHRYRMAYGDEEYLEKYGNS
jgi:hypothetical protein